ncbi:probable 4-coumarate--CoA ligase 3 [Bradysia coprophila]|uniref:probable 4-coumarate--CoA ligase 3 n=1 Tax=Bradysia coprophila TaxID=38358 RepID=UPI00187DCAFF|nr:probable 4-coumarate--CoA ligase 3 [Bradysia coprophila]
MWATTFEKEKKIWKGNDLPTCERNLSIATVLLKSLNSESKKIAQINATTGYSLTFDEIRIRTNRAARNLQKRGIGLATEEIFGIVARSHDHLAPVIFASFSLGCTIYTIDSLFKKFEFVQKFQKIKPNVIFCDINAYDTVVAALAELNHQAKIFTFDGERGGSVNVDHLFEKVDDDADIIPVSVDAVNHLAAIVCSSGTTGPAKGICMSHSMLINAATFTYGWEPQSKRIWLNTYSIYWFRSLLSLIAGTIHCATRVIITEKFTPQRILEIIEIFHVSRLSASPYMLKELIHCDAIKTANLSSVENIFLGAYKLPYEIGKMMDDLLPNGSVNNRYGLTELGGTVAIEVPKFSKGSVGKLKSGNVAKIVDENGKKLGVNERGEICIKSMSMLSGYYQEEALTKESFDEEGFFFTGDIGYFDDECDLFIVDRKKETFEYNSYVISPSEVEGVLLQSPQIAEVCVFSVFNQRGEEVPTAAVVRAANSDITADEIVQLIADYFYDRNKLAGGIYFVDSIPKTPSGKNLRRKMKEIFLDQIATHHRTSTSISSTTEG